MERNALVNDFFPCHDFAIHMEYDPINSEPVSSSRNTLNHTNNNHHYPSQNKPMLVCSKFPEDFFSPIKATNHKQKINMEQWFIDHNDNIIKPHKPKIRLKTQASSSSSSTPRLIIVNTDNEYDEDKELLDLIEGKDIRLFTNDNKKNQSDIRNGSHEDNATALVQTLRQKKKQPKCEIIPEVDESKFNRTKTSFFCSKQQQTIDNDNKDSFEYNLRKSSMKKSRSKTPFIRLQKQKMKDKGKLSIEAIQKESSLMSLKNSQRDDNAINSNAQTENSSNQSNSSTNRKVCSGSSQNQSNGNDGQILKETIDLQKDINAIIKDKVCLNDDMVVKQKLRVIMQNISDIKSVIAQKDKRRVNLVSAPCSNQGMINNDKKPTMKQHQELTEYIDFNIINIGENNTLINQRPINRKIILNKDSWKILSMSHRKRQATAPVKVFSLKK